MALFSASVVFKNKFNTSNNRNKLKTTSNRNYAKFRRGKVLGKMSIQERKSAMNRVVESSESIADKISTPHDN